MIRVNFRNLEPSELARNAVIERLETVITKFPDLQERLISVTLEMHNSRLQAGPDLFSVKLQVMEGRYRGVRLSKSAANLYQALAELTDHFPEKLNRSGDKLRVKQRAAARRAHGVRPQSGG